MNATKIMFIRFSPSIRDYLYSGVSLVFACKKIAKALIKKIDWQNVRHHGTYVITVYKIHI